MIAVNFEIHLLYNVNLGGFSFSLVGIKEMEMNQLS